jgi:hypothetical protein
MGDRFSDSIVSITFPIIASLVFPMLATPTRQSPTGNAASGKSPDLNGVWSAPFTPDISKPIGHQPPFTPYGAERFKNVDEADDPLTQCLPIGPARGIQAGIMPFQVVQTPSVLAILFENQRIFRIIYTDGRSHPKDVDPTWFGDSIGTYEGDTLIVDTVGLNDRTWLDTAGHEHSDQLHIVERFQKLDNNNIKWTVTFEDPKFFIEPWSVTLPITRQNTEIMSYSCEENEKDRAHIQHRAK